MPESSRTGTWIRHAAVLAVFCAGAPALAAPRDHPALLLHVGPPVSKNACSGPVHCQGVATAAAVCDGSTPYFVHLLARNGRPDSSGTLAGLQCGIEYSGWGPASWIRVDAWTLCATLEFPSERWPESGSGNTITWDPVNDCQTGELAVAGYFYVTPYAAATMRLIPRPVDGRSAVASCDPIEYDVYPGRLGRVTFGRASQSAEHAGLNPCLDPPAVTVPYLHILKPKEGDIIVDDDVRVAMLAVDDATPASELEFSWRVDGGLWSQFTSGFYFPGVSLTNLPRGLHSFEARCRDAAGEIGTAGVMFVTEADPNNPPRTILLSGPAEGDTVTGGPVTFRWTGEDDRTPPDSLRFHFSIDGQEVMVGQSRRRTSVTYESPPPGPRRFVVWALDDENEQEWPFVVRNFVYRLPLHSSIRDVTPNPTPGPLTVEIDAASAARIHIQVFDVQGRLVRTVFDGDCPAGHRTFAWDGLNDAGRRVATGTYFVRMKAPGRATSRRFQVVH